MTLQEKTQLFSKIITEFEIESKIRIERNILLMQKHNDRDFSQVIAGSIVDDLNWAIWWNLLKHKSSLNILEEKITLKVLQEFSDNLITDYFKLNLKANIPVYEIGLISQVCLRKSIIFHNNIEISNIIYYHIYNSITKCFYKDIYKILAIFNVKSIFDPYKDFFNLIPCESIINDSLNKHLNII